MGGDTSRKQEQKNKKRDTSNKWGETAAEKKTLLFCLIITSKSQNWTKVKKNLGSYGPIKKGIPQKYEILKARRKSKTEAHKR